MIEPSVSELLDSTRVGIAAHRGPDRPFVTLSYVQSLDGCITDTSGKRLALSGEESLKLTHALRAIHEGILVGIGTVLADDPRLTVRSVDGRNPQTVILDSTLRIPLEARVLAENPPLVITTERAESRREQHLIDAGATVLRLGSDTDGRVDTAAALEVLKRRGIKSLMVEGGHRVITSFLEGDFVDRLVLTVAPVIIGGLHAVGGLERARTPPAFRRLATFRLGDDLVLSYSRIISSR